MDARARPRSDQPGFLVDWGTTADAPAHTPSPGVGTTSACDTADSSARARHGRTTPRSTTVDDDPEPVDASARTRPRRRSPPVPHEPLRLAEPSTCGARGQPETDAPDDVDLRTPRRRRTRWRRSRGETPQEAERRGPAGRHRIVEPASSNRPRPYRTRRPSRAGARAALEEPRRAGAEMGARQRAARSSRCAAQGALVMRRADERWALADVTASPDFVGRGRASTSAPAPASACCSAPTSTTKAACPATRSTSTRSTTAAATSCVSGRPTASCGTRSPTCRAADPGAMYGMLTVRLDVDGEHLVAR